MLQHNYNGLPIYSFYSVITDTTAVPQNME